jgi:microcystin-dependent protein
MANYEATRYDYSGANLTGIQGVNTGIIVPWGDASIPSGFLECDGSAVSRTTYSALFAVVGTTYGSGNGSTTFNLPDLQDDCCIGTSPGKALASTGGANTVASSGNVTGALGGHALTTPELPAHQHSANSGGAGSTNGGTNNDFEVNSPSTGGGGTHTHPASGSFTGNATSVLQPYTALIYIIKT